MPVDGAVVQPDADKSAVDSTVEYLILEIVRYYSIGQDLVAAVHAVETMGFRIGYQLAERCADAPHQKCPAEYLSNNYQLARATKMKISSACVQTNRGHGAYG